jgi:hypothetical protein
VPQPAKPPFVNSVDDLSVHRVFRHIQKGFDEFPYAADDFGEKPLPPDMPAGEMPSVPCHGEHA